LLIHRAYLDVKLEHCKFCLTVSDFNRRHILANYPDVSLSKVSVQRLGVPPPTDITSEAGSTDTSLVMLAVGRLHPVKNHSLLVRACHELKQRNIRFVCMIAGEGPERPALERQIRDLGLGKEVFLLGHLSRHGLDVCYAQANLVVLTSHSEGIPIVLMEAMAHGRTVLAPSITGIPELIEDGKTGFLYRSGSLEHFVERIQFIHGVLPTLGTSRSAAQKYVLEHFNHGKNLHAFGQLFIEQVLGSNRPSNYENPILQQI
jgi:glycosyltransferase involved in cell wall biosynthesis